MTRQETFNRVAKHLLTQGKRSLAVYPGSEDYGQKDCAYRGEGGLSCAVGCLIPDERYRRSWEGQGVENEDIKGLLCGELGHDLRLLQDLQGVHDETNPLEWPEHLEIVAEDNDLEFSEELARLPA